MKGNAANAIRINSLLPWQLADFCQARGTRLFHITTDCVSRAATAPIRRNRCTTPWTTTANRNPSARPTIAWSSAPASSARKSTSASLIAWVKSQAGKEANGFTNHWWNGVTTKQYAEIVDRILRNDWYQTGLFHVFSNRVNKFQLVKAISDRFQLGVRLKPVEANPACDRTLATDKDLCGKLEIPSIEQQIQNLWIRPATKQ